MPDKTKNCSCQKVTEESSSKSLEPNGNLEIHFHDLYHQLRSIGETLRALDYDLTDGIHLPGFGISLCQLSEKVKMIESRVVGEND